jgi:energy-converting hydrogenase Eha subunit H
MVQDALIKTVALLIETVIRFRILKLLGIEIEERRRRKLQNAKAIIAELKIQVALATILASTGFFTGGVIFKYKWWLNEKSI